MGTTKPIPAEQDMDHATSLPAVHEGLADQRALLSRVLASGSFMKSERLSALLRYVCEMAWKGRAEGLNEQRLGNAVFGRRPDYDTSIDGIVRTQASRLRQKLDLYFQSEGAAEPFCIAIPKGGYTPLFLARVAPPLQILPPAFAPEFPATSIPALTTSAPAATESQSTGGDFFPWARRRLVTQGIPGLLCALLVAALILVLLLVRSPAAGHGATAMQHPLWSQVFASDKATLAVPADSGLTLYHSFDGETVSLREYLDGRYRAQAPRFSSAGREQRWSDRKVKSANARYTSIVDLEAAASLTHLADAAKSSVEIRYARDVRPNDLKAGNIILIGAAEANPWVELFQPALDFNIQNDYSTHIFSVFNRQPAPGEPSRWSSVADDPEQRVYGLIAFIAGLSGKNHALILEGTSMAGTEAAWDFISNDAELLPFLKTIARPDGSIPHFQLLLCTRNISASAARIQVVASRVSK